ncbi:MAG: hypothetical protein JNG88_00920, partial [Phycisphaerales bacterium]|nr:hypothetical protein [Phycisphaerales bacterium]
GCNMLIGLIGSGLLALGERVTQDQMLRALRSGFRAEQSTHEAWAYILVGFGLIGLIGIGIQIWRRSQTAVEKSRADHFLTALGVLNLAAEDRAFLTQIRARCGLSEPVAMLTTPANFAYAFAQSGVGQDPRQAARAADFCQRLFDRPLTPAPDANGSSKKNNHFVRES